MMKRTAIGNIALCTFAIAFILIVISFTTSSWLSSDKGARHNSRGLWTHCFSWYSDSNSLRDRRFFVGCDDEIRGFSVPAYNQRVMIATQVFYTLCFISVLLGAILSLLYFCFCSPDHKRFVPMVTMQSYNLLFGASCGVIAILIFVTQRDVYVWMPFHNFVHFGWSLYVAIVGVIVLFVAGAYFLRDARNHAQLAINRSRTDGRARPETPTLEHTIVDVK